MRFLAQLYLIRFLDFITAIKLVISVYAIENYDEVDKRRVICQSNRYVSRAAEMTLRLSALL